MKVLDAKNGFAILWLLLGLLHTGFAIFSLAGKGVSSSAALLSLCCFTILILPLRSLLIELVLGLELRAWAQWTAVGTIIAAFCAFVYFWTILYFSFSGGLPRYFPSEFIGFFFLGVYAVFRIVLLAFQELCIPKLHHSFWFLKQFPMVLLLWLALAYMLSKTTHFTFGLYLNFVLMAVSELMTANILITIKENEEKRKGLEL